MPEISVAYFPRLLAPGLLAPGSWAPGSWAAKVWLRLPRRYGQSNLEQGDRREIHRFSQP